MDFWHWGGFFKSVKGHVIKWWQQVILPVFHLNNNANHKASNAQESKKKTDDGVSTAKSIDTCTEEQVTTYAKGQMEGTGSINSVEDQDAAAILERLEREKQAEAEKTQKEIDEIRRKNQEQERIAAILNANQVNVNAFIEEGKASRENASGEVSTGKQEDMRRAQEILERLNREAAEDEAKKRAEIEAVMQRTDQVEKHEV